MKRVFVFLAVFFLSAFVLLSKYEDRAQLRSFDFAVTVKLQERIDRSAHLRFAALVGNIMEGSTFFASPEFSLIAIALIIFIAFRKEKSRKKWLTICIIPLAFALLTFVEIYGKSVVAHPSPPFFMIKNPITIFPKYYINEQFSYPSGHAARAVFLALTYLSLVARHVSPTKKSLRTRMLAGSILFIYVMLVSVSRIYLGHHWASDVFGGFLIGASAALGIIAML